MFRVWSRRNHPAYKSMYNEWSKASGDWWVKLKKWIWNGFHFPFLPWWNIPAGTEHHGAKKYKKINHHHLPRWLVLSWNRNSPNISVTDMTLPCTSIRATQRQVLPRIQCFRTSRCHSDVWSGSRKSVQIPTLKEHPSRSHECSFHQCAGAFFVMATRGWVLWL